MLGDADWWMKAAIPALSAVGTSAILTAAFQAFFKYRADDRIERLKAQLGIQNSAELARMTSELSRESARDLERLKGEAARDLEGYKQRFSLLASRQTEAAIVLSEKLSILNAIARRLFMVGSPDVYYEDWSRECEEARFAAKEFTDAKRLLFPREIGSLADQIIQRVALGETAKRAAMLTRPPTAEARKEMAQVWADLNGQGAADLAEMTDKLRSLLGGSVS